MFPNSKLLQVSGLLLTTLFDRNKGGSAPISGIEALVHNMLNDKHGNYDDHDDHDHGEYDEGDGWKNGIDLRLFYSYRNFLKKQMQYNMNLRG